MPHVQTTAPVANFDPNMARRLPSRFGLPVPVIVAITEAFVGLPETYEMAFVCLVSLLRGSQFDVGGKTLPFLAYKRIKSALTASRSEIT